MKNKETFLDVFLMSSAILRATTALHVSISRANCEISVSPYSITCTTVFKDGGVHVGHISYHENVVSITATPEGTNVTCDMNDLVEDHLDTVPEYMANIIREFAADDDDPSLEELEAVQKQFPSMEDHKEDDGVTTKSEINWDDPNDQEAAARECTCNDVFNSLLEFHHAGWPDIVTDAKFGCSGSHIFHEIKFTDDGQVMASIYENELPLINLYSDGPKEKRSLKVWTYDNGNWLPSSTIDANLHVSMFNWLSTTLSIDLAHFCMNGFVDDIPDDYEEQTRKSLEEAMDAAAAKANVQGDPDKCEDGPLGELNKEDDTNVSCNDHTSRIRAQDIINTILSENPANCRYEGDKMVVKYITSLGVATVTIKEQFILVEYMTAINDVDTKVTGLIVVAENMAHCNIFLNDERTPIGAWDFDINAYIHPGSDVLHDSCDLDRVLLDITKRDVIKPYVVSTTKQEFTLNDLRQAFRDCSIFYNNSDANDDRIFIAPNAYFSGKTIQEYYEITHITDDGEPHQFAVISFNGDTCDIIVNGNKSNFTLSKGYTLTNVFNMTGKVNGFDGMMNAVCELANVINKKGGDKSGA